MKTIKIIVLFIVLGTFSSAQAWREFGGGSNQVAVYALCMYNNNLIAGGFFDSIGGISARRVASWNGTSWSPLGNGMSGTFYGSGVRAFTIYNGMLIVGGYFDTAGTVISKGVAAWDGANWYGFDGGVQGSYPHVECFAIYRGDLFVGGTFLNAGTDISPGISCWTGNNWRAVGNSIVPPSKEAYFGVYALQEYHSKLYLGGSIHLNLTTDSSVIAQWTGSEWVPVGGGISGQIVKAMTVRNDKLLIGGQFYKAGDLAVNNMVQWDGSQWSSFSNGVDSMIYAFCQVGSKLYTTGIFHNCSGVPANTVAVYDGSSWYPLGSGTNERVLAILNYPADNSNTHIVIGGFFDTAGGVRAKHIALWGKITGFESLGGEVPDNFSLVQNYPNPFNPSTIIEYNIPKSAYVKLVVYDAAGREISSLVNEVKQPGNYKIKFDAKELTSGVYFYRINAGDFSDCKKMLLIK